MKAMVATAYGSANVLELQNVNMPIAKDDEVLVKIYASSATTADGMMLSGTPYFGRLFTGIMKPKTPIPGTGFAGVVESIGKNVESFQPGDRVFGETAFGFSTNAEFLTVSENGVILPMPDNMSFIEAATFCDGPLTSFNFLKNIAQLQVGQKILINGASGSLGTAAVQLAKYFGAEITGVCSTRNVGLVKSLGADHVIDYTKEDFTKGDIRYDIIYDTIGASSFQECKSVLKPGGQYVSPVLKFPLLLQMIWTSKFGSQTAKFAATGLSSVDELRNMLNVLVAIYSEGRLKPVIDRQYPLAKLVEAHTYIATGRKKGNIVINV